MNKNCELHAAKEFREWQPFFVKHEIYWLLASQRGVVDGGEGGQGGSLMQTYGKNSFCSLITLQWNENKSFSL